MNKCLCFCASLIVYLIVCVNATLIIIAWIKPEILHPAWWRVRDRCPAPDINCPDLGLNNKTNYKIYWNLPSIVCKRFGLTFTYAMTDYGFTINEGDEFRGDKVSILYNPGLFPKVLNYTGNLDDIVLINGGIPQDGNLVEHLEAFEETVNKEIPDPNNDGLIIIDMEQFGVVWEQNFGTLDMNQLLSIKRVQDKHPDWTIQEVMRLAKEEFEKAAKRFMLKTIMYGKALRPKGKWGYYQYPLCYNRQIDSPEDIVHCRPHVRTENDKAIWLYHGSDVLYPSLYLGKDGTARGKAGMIRGRIEEAKRLENLVGRELPNIPYVTIKYYHLDGFISDEDLEVILAVPKGEGSPGVVMWGAYADFCTEERCLLFSNWLNNTLGPMAKRILNYS